MERNQDQTVIGAALGLGDLLAEPDQSTAQTLGKIIDDFTAPFPDYPDDVTEGWVEVDGKEFGCPKVKVPKSFAESTERMATMAAKLWAIDNTYSAAEYFCTAIFSLGIPFKIIFDDED